MITLSAGLVATNSHPREASTSLRGYVEPVLVLHADSHGLHVLASGLFGKVINIHIIVVAVHFTMPLTLRPSGEAVSFGKVFKLVGECHLHGVMYGESVPAARDSDEFANVFARSYYVI